jgi:hypothetical protein
MMNQKREIKDQSTAAGDNLEDLFPVNETIRMESDICGGADSLLLDALENPQNIAVLYRKALFWQVAQLQYCYRWLHLGSREAWTSIVISPTALSIDCEPR